MRLLPRRVTSLVAVFLMAAAGFGQAAPHTWPTNDGTYTIDNFHFEDGESIEHLRLHYRLES